MVCNAKLYINQIAWKQQQQKSINFYFTNLNIKSTGGDLLHDFHGAAQTYILSELERRKSDLRTQLVWIGAQREPGFTSRTWRWVNGKYTINNYIFLLFKNSHINYYI